MWKTIVLCGSLFGGTALGVAAAAQWVQPGALPAVAAIGLCLVGVTLILLATTASPTISEEPALEASPVRAVATTTTGRRRALDLAPAMTPSPENRAIEELL